MKHVCSMFVHPLAVYGNIKRIFIAAGDLWLRNVGLFASFMVVIRPCHASVVGRGVQLIVAD